MKTFFSRMNNEDGSMILIAILLLVILTIMGITSISTVVVEQNIAVNDQLNKMTFYHADAGLYGTPKLIRATIFEGAGLHEDELSGRISYLGTGNGQTNADGNAFYEQIMAFTDGPGYDGGVADVLFAFQGGDVRIDVQHLGARYAEGGGMEFASGADGIGPVGAFINYGLFAVGSAPRNSSSSIYANYRYAIGIPGGL